MASKNAYQENEYPATDRDLYAQVHQQSFTYSMSNGYNQYDCVNTIQTSYRNQNGTSALNTTNPNMYPECGDNANWMFDYRFVNDGLKLPDKMETIEITSKDLSPASCCSNFDLLLPDCYKNVGHSKSGEKQWFYNSNYNYQKYMEFPSCAQLCENNSDLTNTVRFCSIQKAETENLNKSCGYSSDCILYNKTENTNSLLYNNLDNALVSQEYFPHTQPISYDSLENLDQNADVSNEESDIIVEESDDDVTDYSEDHEKNYTTNCVICNVLYAPMGNQFYFLTSESPLTMSTQKPVISKLKDIVGFVPTKKYYLCSHCLGLINTIDHLQLKLDNCKSELQRSFEKTCKVTVDKKVKPWKSLVLNCKLCRKRFSLHKFYQYHMKKHKSSFLCEFCGKKYFRIHNFKSHLRMHRKRTAKTKTFTPYVCKLCNKPFRTHSNLKEHMNFCSGDLPYKCTHCDKKFPSTTKMKNHIKLKHDKKFVAICSICNIGFVKTSDYKSHMISHSTEKKFSCPKCAKTYKTLSNLNFHMKLHNKTLPFVCTLCNKGFMRKEYLEAHVNVHNGVRNFACQTCGKTFVSQKNLDSHSKYHDGSVKKRSCTVCGKVLTTGFEEHLRTHGNLREFECELCEVRFNTKGALAKHKKCKHVNK